MSELTEQIQVSDDVLNFIYAMCAAVGWDGLAVAYFLEKPWKWADEFAAWLNNGKPSGERTADYIAFERLVT